MNERISVVMACYFGDRVQPLREAVDSIIAQTISFYEFLIVIDGPIEPSMMIYLDNLCEADLRIQLHRLKENKGAAYARNYGMSKATGDFIAIMDADDIAFPYRFSSQLVAIKNEKVDAVWGWQEEFYDQTNEFAGFKRSAEHHYQICDELKFRCLLPDPTTFIRRECFNKTGGYGEYSDVNIDYHFFVKMALNGCYLYCVPDVLIKVRVSPGQRKRRGGARLLMQDIAMRNWMRREKFINWFEYIKAVLAISVFRMIPNFARDLVYRRILRHRV